MRHDASQSIGHLGGVGTGRGRVVREPARRRGRLVRDHLLVRDGSRVGGRRGEESARRLRAGVYAAGVAAASPAGDGGRLGGGPRGKSPREANAFSDVVSGKTTRRVDFAARGATFSGPRSPANSRSERLRCTTSTLGNRTTRLASVAHTPRTRHARTVARAIPARRIERGARRASRAPPRGKVHGEVPERLESLRDVAARVARQRRANRGGEVTTRRAQRSMQRNRTGGTTGDGTAERRRWREVARRRERRMRRRRLRRLTRKRRTGRRRFATVLNRSASGSRARPISDVVSIRSTAIFPSRYAAEISSSTASRHSHMNSCASCCANPSNLARRRCTARFTSIGDTTVAPAARASSPRAPASASARVRRRAAASRANAENTGDVSRDAPGERRDPRIVRETTYAAQYL